MDATSVIIGRHAELERAFDAVQLGKELLERMHQLQGAPER